jgi:hypothetical protein
MTLAVAEPVVPIEPVRARFRALGLAELPAGASWFYALPEPPGRLLLVLQAMGRGAQIHLYPHALGRAPGAAQWFYARLEADGFGMGSKAGPSISLALDDEGRMATFWDAFARLIAGEPATGGAR